MGGAENIGDKKQISLLYSPYSHAPAYTMRPVDMSSHVIIKPGLDWPFNTEVPNSKNMIPLLERNESLVTWLQPCKGEIKDQFPVIKMGSRYYTLSLRQMKVTLFAFGTFRMNSCARPQALWKHVRLKKNFINRETIPHVGGKCCFFFLSSSLH
jgi:hypothetical protein